MERRTLLIIGTVLVAGAVLAAAAVAQNTDAEEAPVPHECTSEMMEKMGSGRSDMAQSCTPEMMDSGDCEDMTGTSMAECGSIMGDIMSNRTGGHMDDPDHCGDMGDMMSGTKGQMMGTTNKKGSMM